MVARTNGDGGSRVVAVAPAPSLSNLQTLNLALATGFIVTCGDAVQAIWDEKAEEAVGSTNVVLLVLLIAIGAKVAYDDHVGLAAGKIRPFALLDTTFLIATYSLLISASALIIDFDLSVKLLASYLLVLGSWNALVLLIIFCSSTKRPPVRSFQKSRGWKRPYLWFRCLRGDAERRDEVLHWMIIDFVGAAVFYSLVVAELPREVILVAIGIFLLFDLFTSRSFGK